MTSSVKHTAAGATTKRSAVEHDNARAATPADSAYRGVTPAVIGSSAGTSAPQVAPTRQNAAAVEITNLTHASAAAAQPAIDPFRVLVSENGLIAYDILVGSPSHVDDAVPALDAMIHTLGAMSTRMASVALDAERARANHMPERVDADETEIASRLSAVSTQQQLAVQSLSPADGTPGFALSLFQ